MTITGTTTGRAICQNLPFIHYPGLSLLDSSLRWNDDGGGREWVCCYSNSSFAMPDKCLTAAPSVIPACLQQAGLEQAAEESSGLCNPFPRKRE